MAADYDLWDLANLNGFLPLAYGTPTFLLYIFLIVILLIYFRTPFYILFVINGISETLWWLSGMIKYRFAMAPIFFPVIAPVFAHLPCEYHRSEVLPSAPAELRCAGWTVDIIFFLNYALLITSRSSNFLMTLNRFTVMQMPAH
ncbi:hypothetical protein AAVH_35113, partial [Aphelenchoides avenae]